MPHSGFRRLSRRTHHRCGWPASRLASKGRHRIHTHARGETLTLTPRRISGDLCACRTAGPLVTRCSTVDATGSAFSSSWHIKASLPIRVSNATDAERRVCREAGYRLRGASPLPSSRSTSRRPHDRDPRPPSRPAGIGTPTSPCWRRAWCSSGTPRHSRRHLARLRRRVQALRRPCGRSGRPRAPAWAQVE